ncbi:MAG TPA: hypothetical protein VMS22_24635 [Candidatus Eisenbacteria bacterium]|nr:hypothetical protein [Candidatus Eisenbacteria bacterium]
MRVVKALRLLDKADRLRAAVERRGKVSAACAVDLDDMLGNAKNQCRRWLGSF